MSHLPDSHPRWVQEVNQQQKYNTYDFYVFAGSMALLAVLVLGILLNGWIDIAN